MKNQQSMLILLVVLSVLHTKSLLVEADDKQTHNVAYFQASSLQNQLGGPDAAVVKYNSIDGLNEYSNYNNGTFAYKCGGVYFVMYAAQIGSTNGKGDGEIHIWERELDNQNKPNSNCIQSIRGGSTSVLVYPTLVQASVGRDTTLMYSAVQTNKCCPLGLIASTPQHEPVVPSIITSKIQLTDVNTAIPYAQLSSSESQFGDLTPTAVKFNDINVINEIDTATIKQDGVIKFNQPGLYFTIAGAQVGSAPDSNAAGDVHLWTRVNNKDIANSNTIQTIRNGNTAVLINQGIVKVEAGDKFQLMLSRTNKNLGVVASTPKDESAVPSTIFSTFWLGKDEESTAYAQLSSSETQWARSTPQSVKLNNDDGSKHITNDHGVVQFEKPGAYFIMAAAQVAGANKQSVGNVHLWMRLNGKDMDNSNTIQTINDDTTVLVCQTTAVIKAGDRLEMMFSSNVEKDSLGFVATQPKDEPLVPSVIFSAFKSPY